MSFRTGTCSYSHRVSRAQHRGSHIVNSVYAQQINEQINKQINMSSSPGICYPGPLCELAWPFPTSLLPSIPSCKLAQQEKHFVNFNQLTNNGTSFPSPTFCCFLSFPAISHAFWGEFHDTRTPSDHLPLQKPIKRDNTWSMPWIKDIIGT